MVVALDTVVKQLEESEIIAKRKLINFIPPRATPKDGEQLLQELLKNNLLTKFQAQQFAAGRAEAVILGNYVILERIGAGGMGQVFKAEHRHLKRIVALKTLPPNAMKDGMAVARFQREFEAAGKLRHPNIVAADDANEANGVHFLVMEYVPGSDLAALVKEQGPLTVKTAVNYILQTARGLEFAHQEGVIHRDVKPANLLLDKHGTVKILDMGLARIVSENNIATQSELTGSGSGIGTVDFMSPEQALDAKHADVRADVYSLGCTLFYLLTGKGMYEGDSALAKLIAHREQPIPRLRVVRPDVSAQLEVVFRRMVAKSVADRYQNMGEIISDLERCVMLVREVPLHQGAPPPWKQSLSRTIHGILPRWLWLAVITGILAISALTMMNFNPRMEGGTLVVDVNQPQAVVEVFDRQGELEISHKSAQGPISLAITGGQHRLTVKKDGFRSFATDFEMPSHGHRTIKAQLVSERNVPTVVQVMGSAGGTEALVVPARADSPAAPADHQDRPICEWILSRGGRVEVVKQGVVLPVPQAVAERSQLPRGEIRISSIDFQGCRELKDEELSQLVPLTEVTSLNFGGRTPTDEGMKYISRLASLRSLRMDGGLSVSPQGLRALQSLPRLHSLELRMRVVSPRDAAALGELPELSTIYVYGITSDEVLEALNPSRRLTSFTLGAGMGLSNQGLEFITDWPNLRTLIFTSKLVTNEGILRLGKLKSLQSLSFSCPNVTSTVVAELQAELPTCKLSRN